VRPSDPGQNFHLPYRGLVVSRLNDRELLGEFANKTWNNWVNWSIIIVLFLLSYDHGRAVSGPKIVPLRREAMPTTNQHEFVAVHLLDDNPEQKVNMDRLGPMPVIGAVRWSLVALRAYLVPMFGLVLYSVAGPAGFPGANN
jgi:hypothetical protein